MIDGIEVRDLQVNADERGHLVEMFRSNWDTYDPNPEMSYYSMTIPALSEPGIDTRVARLTTLFARRAESKSGSMMIVGTQLHKVNSIRSL
jgi:hypothetical protein